MKIFLVSQHNFMGGNNSHIEPNEYFSSEGELALYCPDSATLEEVDAFCRNRGLFSSTRARFNFDRISLPPGYTIAGKYFPCDSNGNVISLQSYDSPAELRAAHPTAARSCVVLNGEFPKESYMVNIAHTENGVLCTRTTQSPYTAYGCKLCGFPGHNSRTCEINRVYDKVGIEIEGRFSDTDALIREVRAAGATSCGDGSIRGHWTSEPYCGAREVQTKPGTVIEALRQLVKFYPDSTDYSCGMHVHVSFLSDTHISQLYSQAFFEYFRAKWLAWADAKGLPVWHSLRRRLAGENDYCHQNVERPANYLRDDLGTEFSPFNHEDRYMQLNFLAWGEHKTVECRLLPMFRESALAVEAVVYLLQIFHDWLNTDCDSLAPSLPYAALEVPTLSVVPDVEQYVVDDELLDGVPLHEPSYIDLNMPPPPEEGSRRVFLNLSNRDALAILGVGPALAA